MKKRGCSLRGLRVSSRSGTFRLDEVESGSGIPAPVQYGDQGSVCRYEPVVSEKFDNELLVQDSVFDSLNSSLCDISYSSSQSQPLVAPVSKNEQRKKLRSLLWPLIEQEHITRKDISAFWETKFVQSLLKFVEGATRVIFASEISNRSTILSEGQHRRTSLLLVSCVIEEEKLRKWRLQWQNSFRKGLISDFWENFNSTKEGWGDCSHPLDYRYFEPDCFSFFTGCPEDSHSALRQAIQSYWESQQQPKSPESEPEQEQNTPRPQLVADEPLLAEHSPPVLKEEPTVFSLLSLPSPLRPEGADWFQGKPISLPVDTRIVPCKTIVQ